MAIRVGTRRPLNALEIISENDDAVDMEASDWAEYQKTADVSKLKFVAGKQPTKFLCNFSLKGKEAAQIKNSMLDGRDEDGQPKVALGSWSFKIVKYTLKDIINPADLADNEKIVFKKDEHGYAHDDVLTELDSMGILNEIFAFYTYLVLAGAKANAKNS